MRVIFLFFLFFYLFICVFITKEDYRDIFYLKKKHLGLSEGHGVAKVCVSYFLDVRGRFMKRRLIRDTWQTNCDYFDADARRLHAGCSFCRPARLQSQISQPRSHSGINQSNSTEVRRRW